MIASALKRAGAQVEVHDDHFKTDEHDEVWLREVAGRGWIVLAKDYRIRYREPAKRAIRRAGARVFVLKRSENLSGPEMAAIFTKALPAIYRTAESEPPPFIAKVGKDGSVSVWWPDHPKGSRKDLRDN